MFYLHTKEKEGDSSHSGAQRTSHDKWQIPNKGVANIFAGYSVWPQCIDELIFSEKF
jgi:hypothetical protein